MKRIDLKTAALPAAGSAALLIAAGLLTAAPAQAGDYGFDEVDVAPRSGRVIVEERRVEERRVVRPVVETRLAPLHAYRRSAYGRHYDEPFEGECRVIVKKRENGWGEVVIKRIRICD